jgi:hypothetical protein
VNIRSENFLNELIEKFVNPNYLVNKLSLKDNLSPKLNKKSFSIISSNNIEISVPEDKSNSGSQKSLDLSDSKEIEITRKNSNLISIGEKNLSIKDSFSTKPFKGYSEITDFKRILVVTHGGFIMELINVIRKKQNLEFNGKNNSHNTGLYVIKIYCKFCGAICKLIEGQCINTSLEFDFILINDKSHLDK